MDKFFIILKVKKRKKKEKEKKTKINYYLLGIKVVIKD